jgi:thiaminase/transcriptional activator TenA
LPGPAASIAERLWRENQDLAQAALAHRFVRGLADGSLPRAVFQTYVAQDAFFLDAFARAYALALARCPDQDGLRSFFDLLAGALDELKLHAGYAARLGIDLAAIEPLPAASAYTDFLLATAGLGSVGETCAAMTPCMRLYAFLGQSLAERAVDGLGSNPYAEWIHTYADPAFEALASRLEGLLDRYAAAGPRLARLYRRAMRLELAFFEAPFEAPLASGG